MCLCERKILHPSELHLRPAVANDKRNQRRFHFINANHPPHAGLQIGARSFQGHVEATEANTNHCQWWKLNK